MAITRYFSCVCLHISTHYVSCVQGGVCVSPRLVLAILAVCLSPHWLALVILAVCVSPPWLVLVILAVCLSPH